MGLGCMAMSHVYGRTDEPEAVATTRYAPQQMQMLDSERG